MTDKSKDYIKVIDILISNSEVDHRRISLELAKVHPDIFVKIYEGKYVSTELKDLVISHWKAGNHIEAIKQYRAATMAGLKDSKDACERIAEEAGLKI